MIKLNCVVYNETRRLGQSWSFVSINLFRLLWLRDHHDWTYTVALKTGIVFRGEIAEAWNDTADSKLRPHKFAKRNNSLFRNFRYRNGKLLILVFIDLSLRSSAQYNNYLRNSGSVLIYYQLLRY